MRAFNRFWMMSGLTVLASLGSAHAQERCKTDKLGAAAAEARLNWARICGLTVNVQDPNGPKKDDTGVPAPGGGNFIDYKETLESQFRGVRTYSTQGFNYKANEGYVNSLYKNMGLRTQSDGTGLVAGYKLWGKPANAKKPLPSYPTFGTTDSDTTGNQLFPHPSLADCRLYSDREGKLPIAAGAPFYVNVLCTSVQPTNCATPQATASAVPASTTMTAQAAPAPGVTTSAQLCQTDGRNAQQAEARLNWARKCSFTQNVKNPFGNFDTGAPASNGGNLLPDLQDYRDAAADSDGRKSYWGTVREFFVNDSYFFALYNNGATTQSIEACGVTNGYYSWSRPAARKKTRPLYPVYGSAADASSPGFKQLFPKADLSDCGLYDAKSGGQASDNFYVVGYCMSSQ